MKKILFFSKYIYIEIYLTKERSFASNWKLWTIKKETKNSCVFFYRKTDTTDKDLTVFFPGGLTWGTTIEKVKEMYGEPKDEYTGDSGFAILTYQEDTDHYAKLTFLNGKIKGYELYI